MKIRTLLGLAAVGGLYYAHRKRGGELTAASIKDSFGALRDAALKKWKTLESSAKQQVPAARQYESELH